MKLVTKLLEEKDPFICVCFDKEHDARKLNEDLVLKWPHDKYTIVLLPVNSQQITLMLVSDNNQRIYANLKFEYSKLEWWINYTRKNSSFRFVHVIEEFEKHKSVKTWTNNKPYVLNVKSYTINEEALAGLVFRG